jgi:hypothetical protein
MGADLAGDQGAKRADGRVELKLHEGSSLDTRPPRAGGIARSAATPGKS